jgi:hypothetical protein
MRSIREHVLARQASSVRPIVLGRQVLLAGLLLGLLASPFMPIGAPVAGVVPAGTVVTAATAVTPNLPCPGTGSPCAPRP